VTPPQGAEAFLDLDQSPVAVGGVTGTLWTLFLSIVYDRACVTVTVAEGGADPARRPAARSRGLHQPQRSDDLHEDTRIALPLSKSHRSRGEIGLR
jgi:hypothetical protein